MKSVLNILFIPPCGYFTNTDRLICREGKLMLHWIGNARKPRFLSLKSEYEDLESDEVMATPTKFFKI